MIVEQCCLGTVEMKIDTDQYLEDYPEVAAQGFDGEIF